MASRFQVDTNTYAGEFCVMAYGDLSVDEMFDLVRYRKQMSEGLASVRSKTSYEVVKLPSNARVDMFLMNMRAGNPEGKYPKEYAIYRDPYGPALAVVCNYKTRLRASRSTGHRTPETMVLFLGTSIIE